MEIKKKLSNNKSTPKKSKSRKKKDKKVKLKDYQVPERVINESYINDVPNHIEKIIDTLHPDAKAIINSGKIKTFGQGAGELRLVLDNGMRIHIEDLQADKKTYTVRDKKGNYLAKNVIQ